MNTTIILSTVFKIAVPVFILFLIYFLVKLLDYFASKTKNENTKLILLKIESFALGAVKEVEQTLVPIYTANGEVLNPDNAAKLKDVAMGKVNDLLGDTGKEEAQNLLKLAEDQFQAFLSTQIEKQVYDLKPTTTIVPNKTITLTPSETTTAVIIPVASVNSTDTTTSVSTLSS